MLLDREVNGENLHFIKADVCGGKGAGKFRSSCAKIYPLMFSVSMFYVFYSFISKGSFEIVRSPVEAVTSISDLTLKHALKAILLRILCVNNGYFPSRSCDYIAVILMGNDFKIT